MWSHGQKEKENGNYIQQPMVLLSLGNLFNFFSPALSNVT